MADTLYSMSRYSFAVLLHKKVCYMLTCPISCLFLKEYELLFFANFLEKISERKSWGEIGVEGSDNMFMTNTVDDNFDENWNE